jgi:hypothetical protein
MSTERKKVEKKVIAKVAPKKRPEPEPEPEPEPKVRAKASDDKYIRLATDSKQEEFKAISERVHRGELKWAYYATDNGKGYHHYLVIKK